MARPQVVTLDEAIDYTLVTKRKFDWLNVDITKAHFTKENCPMLYQRKGDEILTWKDFVLLLYGNPNKTNAGTYFPYETALGVNNNPWGNKRWGCTLGKYQGVNGKPIAETKALDEYFWYYDGYMRYLFNNWQAGRNDCLIFNHRYSGDKHEGSWIEGVCDDTSQTSWMYLISGGEFSNYHNRWLVLTPGVYGIRATNYSNLTVNGQWLDSRFYIREVGSKQLPNPDTIPFLACRNHGTGYWTTTNAIFFVDSPVEINFHYAQQTNSWGACNWECQIFRITPPPSVAPNYWKAE